MSLQTDATSETNLLLLQHPPVLPEMLPNPDQIREALVLPQVQGKLCSHSTRAEWVGREVGGKVFSTGVIQYLGGQAGRAALTGFKLDAIDMLFI